MVGGFKLLTGRQTNSRPAIQNLPGSITDKLMWAMERGETEKVELILKICRKVAGHDKD
jgi:hypothetical protein